MSAHDRALRERSPLTAASPSLVVFTGIIPVQVGAGPAGRLFSQVGPAGMTGLGGADPGGGSTSCGSCWPPGGVLLLTRGGSARAAR